MGVLGTEVVLVRHGETDWNAEGRLQGQNDPPLNDRGREQAESVALHLAKVQQSEEKGRVEVRQTKLSGRLRSRELLRS